MHHTEREQIHREVEGLQDGRGGMRGDEMSLLQGQESGGHHQDHVGHGEGEGMTNPGPKTVRSIGYAILWSRLGSTASACYLLYEEAEE